MIQTTSPRTGQTRDTHLRPSSPEDVEREVLGAQEAASCAAMSLRARRAELLEVMADTVEAHRGELVALAEGETALGRDRLEAELTRTIGQFRLFADAVEEGSYLEAAIDHAVEPTGTSGVRLPDVRRMLIPLGVVAVFGASNFPFAFSVLGGDTASALAAGCPVVAKAHGSHPLTSERSLLVLREAARAAGFPVGTFGMVLGQDGGRTLVAHPQVRAVSLTGSLAAATALQQVINQRPEPIPLFGELSSVNPLLITPGAAEQRAHEIADGLATSVLASAGQLCTKSGVALVPRGGSGDRLLERLQRHFRTSAPAPLLNRRIHDDFVAAEKTMTTKARRLAGSGDAAAQDSGSLPGTLVGPVLLEVTAEKFSEELGQEQFGPWLVVVRYGDLEEALTLIQSLPGSLTATVHSGDGEAGMPEVFSRLAPGAGRLVHNGYPTGVRVSWAQHHGGPWPATNTQHTSVGITAMRRWMRPLAWQDVPEQVLPAELRDDLGGNNGGAGLPRRIDGVLSLPRS